VTRSPARLPVFALAALLAAVVVPGAASAQNLAPSGRIVSFGLGGGVTVPVDDARSAFDNGFNGHGFVRLNLPVFPIQPRLDFTFQKLDIKDIAFVDPTLGAGGTFNEGEQSIFSGLAQAQLALLKAGPIQPYLVAGVGLSSLKTKLEGEPGTDNVSESATKLTVNGGAGLNLRMGPISGFVEGRIHNIVNDGELMDFESVQLVPVSFGLVF
jgi:opacity protein-like surface antigen